MNKGKKQELNERVAKKLGWAQCRGNGLPGWHNSKNNAKQCNKYFNGYHEPIPDYADDIAAAWEIVEKMPGRLELGQQPNGKWWASFDAGVFGDGKFIKADTAPEAIVKAFLKL